MKLVYLAFEERYQQRISFNKTDGECCQMFAFSNWWSDFGEAIVLVRGVTWLSGDSISQSGKRESDVKIEKFPFTEYHEHSLLNFFTFVSLLESAIDAVFQLSSTVSR